MEKITAKDFTNRILTGMSIGIVVALIPGALLGEIAKALNWGEVVNLTKMAQSLLPAIMGLCIAMQFKLTPIQSGTLAMTVMIASGVIKFNNGAMVLSGIGDVINAGLIAALAVFVLRLVGNNLKAYTILVVPTLMVVLIGGLGLFTLPYVSKVTSFVGQVVSSFTSLQPILAGILIAITFSVMIISPISTAGVAVAITLAGIGSGAANLGICAAGFGLCIAGFKVNGVGTSIAHFLGSPKMQMANFIKKPAMVLPIIVNAAICGAFAGILNIQGTPASAGFGISGLIGPVNHLNIVGYTTKNIITSIFVFVVLPVVLSFVTTYLFDNVLHITKQADYKVEFK